jgi:hypothetical protein
MDKFELKIAKLWVNVFRRRGWDSNKIYAEMISSSPLSKRGKKQLKKLIFDGRCGNGR